MYFSMCIITLKMHEYEYDYSKNNYTRVRLIKKRFKSKLILKRVTHKINRINIFF